MGGPRALLLLALLLLPLAKPLAAAPSKTPPCGMSCCLRGMQMRSCAAPGACSFKCPPHHTPVAWGYPELLQVRATVLCEPQAVPALWTSAQPSELRSVAPPLYRPPRPQAA